MKKNQTPLIILGTDDEARLAMDIAQSLDILVYGFITKEDEWVNKEINDILVVAKVGEKDANTLLKDENVKLVLAISDAEERRSWVDYLEKFPQEIINLIHPLAHVSEYAKLGRGNLIHAGVSIQANCIVGSFNLLDSQVSLGLDVTLGDHCTLEAGVKVGRNVTIGDDTHISQGAIIYKGVKVGEGAFVGAGAVVMRDVPEDTTVFGNPAHEIDEID